MFKNLALSVMLSSSIGTTAININTRDNNNYNFTESYPQQWSTEYVQSGDNHYYKSTKTGQGPFTSTLISYTYAKIDSNNEIITDEETYYSFYLISINPNQIITLSQIYFDMYINCTQPINLHEELSIYTTTNQEIYNNFKNINWQSYIEYNTVYNDFVNGTYGYNYNFVYGVELGTNQNIISVNNESLNLAINTTNYILILSKMYPTYYDNPMYINITQQKQLNLVQNLQISGIYSINPSSQEILDLPSLLFTILTMPFTFISQAFNLTLFPGTPYALNISNLFLTIIGVLIFVWILSLIIKRR